MATLTLKDPTGRDRVYELLEDLIAGRASSNAIQIVDEKSSRQHFRVERRADGFYVLDLGSTNGTRINSVKIAEPTRLKPGDVISVGKTRLEFSDQTQPEALPQESAPHAELPPIHDDLNDRVTIASSVSDDGGLARLLQAERARKLVAEATPAPSGDESEALSTAARSAETLDGPRYILRVLEGATPGKLIELGADTITLGRHASNSIPVDDDVASNFHAEIKREAVGYTVSDLGSTNGTKVMARGHDEFQKVLKSPLKPGAQIRVGKTLLEFDNIGTPVPEDDVHAVAADAFRTQPPVAPVAGSGGGMLIKVAALVIIALLITAGVAFLPGLLKRPGTVASGTNPTTTATTTEKKPARVATNLVPNAGFDEGTEDDGSPREFIVLKGATEVSVKVTAEADHGDDKGSGKRGLQINKGGAKTLLKPTVVETRDAVKIDPTATYEIGGWLRNDEDGIFGLRVVWVAGDRAQAEHPVVLKDSQEWKQISGVFLTPPPWATGARVGVFSQGRNGKSMFDDLVFKEKVGTPAPPARGVKFNAVSVQFDGVSGRFNVEAQGKAIVEDGTLRLEAQDGKAACDFTSAFKPQLKKLPDSDELLAEGKLYDFTQQDLAAYRFSAKPGAAGVDLHATLDAPADSGSKAALRFNVVGPAALGDIELIKADGGIERLTAAEDKSEGAYKSVLFNAGKAPQLAVSFAQPVQVHVKHEGKRLAVEFGFQGDLQVALAPEDIEQKKAVLSGIADIDKALGAHEWASAESKLKDFKEKVAQRSPQAQEAAQKFSAQLDAALAAAQADAAKELQNMRATPTADAIGRGKQALQRIAEAWKGSQHETDFNDGLGEAEKLNAQFADADAEKKADEYFKQAQTYIDKKIYNVAISFLKVKILNDPALSKTQTAEKAKPLLAQIEELQSKMDILNGVTDHLKSMVKNEVSTQRYNEAIKSIEADIEYKKYKPELKEIQEFIDELRKKAGNRPPP